MVYLKYLPTDRELKNFIVLSLLAICTDAFAGSDLDETPKFEDGAGEIA